MLGLKRLHYHVSRAHLGLKYDSIVETLALDIPSQQGTLHGTRQNISELIARVQDSVGLWAGPDLDNLREQRWRSDAEAYDQPTAMYTGDTEPLGVVPNWDRGATILIQQPDPLPLTLNAIIAEVQLGS